ncbi:hypothetical protein PV10_03810 [Exophiala mesophila]|uniref:Uncharacterized protein n=1 Tax=Exophiala mesophila TaxID=212818 RepID=A0A0D1ZFB0_EXOME|nr:uncharacterized protein PV10_03810 [Exophiala mesophila]KIV92519.1 hypothetical protein PV10_03810 [Exophiala mesophila]
MAVQEGYDIYHPIELDDSDDSSMIDQSNVRLTSPSIKIEQEEEKTHIDPVPCSDSKPSFEDLAPISTLSAIQQTAAVQDSKTRDPLKKEGPAITATQPSPSSVESSMGPDEEPLFFPSTTAPANTELTTEFHSLPVDGSDIKSTTRIPAERDDLGAFEALRLFNEGKIRLAEENQQIMDSHSDHDAGQTNRFEKIKKEYFRKREEGTLTDIDDIRFLTAQRDENQRLRELKNSREEIPEIDAAPQPGLESGGAEFYRPAIPSPPMPPLHPKARSKPASRNYVNAQETRDAIAVGAALQSTKRKASTISGVTKVQKGQPRIGARRGQKPNLSNLTSLGRSDIIQQAQANSSAPDMPRSSARDKRKALQELVASIPSADQHQAKSDSRALLDATKKFRGKGSVRPDGQGGWQLKNMKSSLHNHQLLGAAFLRDRETGKQMPLGGMVCDEMGFGKTVQMIANILDGQPEPGSANNTTIIILPASLLKQWMLELERHVKPGALGRILCYHSGARMVSNNTLEDLRAYNIILTTYSEIQRKFYRKNVGPLHRIKYHRIVLDEAHHIKNRHSKTSIAVRALAGEYRWIISGTPILNYVEELFAYFSFLRVPHTGNFETYCHNYCKRSGVKELDMSRLHNILRAIMLRRTHTDTIFNAPIVQLPEITYRTHLVEFNQVERTIYTIVKQRFIHDINLMYRAGELNARPGNVLALLAHLRMLCSHVLLCQDVLKRLLSAGNIESLWRMTKNESDVAKRKEAGDFVKRLRGMIASGHNTVPTRNSTQSTPATANSEIDERDDGRQFGKDFEFRRFLQDLSDSEHWTELHLRTICSACRSYPDTPVCTSCFHIYCEECIALMKLESEQSGQDKMSCKECDTIFDETWPTEGLAELGFLNKDNRRKAGLLKERRKEPIRASRGPFESRRLSGRVFDDEDFESKPKSQHWIKLMNKGSVLPSAKLLATKAAILNWRENCPQEKIIIFSQWLGLCHILSQMCKEEGWGCVMLNGTMSMDGRDRSITQFRDNPNTIIMICSLKTGGVGLNLTMASKVIILDLWFNSSIEAQAYCRVFRMGQKKEVEVLRFVVRDSIDDDLVKMQERKNAEIDSAIGSECLEKRATINQLLSLFGEVSEDGNDEFILVEDNYMDDNLPMEDRVPPRPF